MPDISVHPRACGESGFHLDAGPGRRGSSPRMRGKLFLQAGRALPVRFIPAHAGKAKDWICTGFQPTVHPRACGESLANYFRVSVDYGSSPRMRGKLERENKELRLPRFIPAHAGKAFESHPEGQLQTVHPRACGESVSIALTGSLFAGSSPRMRGKPRRPRRLLPLGRFIPAHAGKAGSWLNNALTSSVHPRACGESIPVGWSANGYYGSSPRMRGKLCNGRCYRYFPRFIPAHAGKASILLHRRARWCGSSPRMRGKPASAIGYPSFLRFIPAHAGKAAG